MPLPEAQLPQAFHARQIQKLLDDTDEALVQSQARVKIAETYEQMIRVPGKP